MLFVNMMMKENLVVVLLIMIFEDVMVDFIEKGLNL